MRWTIRSLICSFTKYLPGPSESALFRLPSGLALHKDPRMVCNNPAAPESLKLTVEKEVPIRVIFYIECFPILKKTELPIPTPSL